MSKFRMCTILALGTAAIALAVDPKALTSLLITIAGVLVESAARIYDQRR